MLNSLIKCLKSTGNCLIRWPCGSACFVITGSLAWSLYGLYIAQVEPQFIDALKLASLPSAIHIVGSFSGFWNDYFYQERRHENRSANNSRNEDNRLIERADPKILPHNKNDLRNIQHGYGTTDPRNHIGYPMGTIKPPLIFTRSIPEPTAQNASYLSAESLQENRNLSHKDPKTPPPSYTSVSNMN